LNAGIYYEGLTVIISIDKVKHISGIIDKNGLSKRKNGIVLFAFSRLKNDNIRIIIHYSLYCFLNGLVDTLFWSLIAPPDLSAINKYHSIYLVFSQYLRIVSIVLIEYYSIGFGSYQI